MFVIVKYVTNQSGVDMPVLIVDTHSEVLEFSNIEKAEEMRNLFQKNSDSGYRYEVKKIGTIR